MSIPGRSSEKNPEQSSLRPYPNLSTRLSSWPAHSSESDKTQGQFELKLVYRTLRLVSDWTLSDFFSEVCIEGEGNVSKGGPVILTPSHHNELIDIATLSATIPHRRIIAYWAKASLFRNPVGRFILSSAGAIPVARTPRPQKSPTEESNNAQNGNGTQSVLNNSSKHAPNGQQALFDATYKELAKRGGGVLGVFPEGTSYTLPRIVQVKEGAAHATLGYVQYLCASDTAKVMDRPGNMASPISLVPVGITYTDKSRYRSRLYVRYGRGIDLKPFMRSVVSDSSGSFDADGDTFQLAVHKLTEEIEQEMIKLTINAPNWSVLYAARTARALLWEDERSLHLRDFVNVSQRLVKIFDCPSEELSLLRKSLLKYHALLHHTSLTHATLSHVPFPPSHAPPGVSVVTAFDESNREVLSKPSVLKLTTSLPSYIAPLLVSLPTHAAHIPAYALAALVSRAFAGDEEESCAQYKAIFGGLGRVLGTLAAGFAVIRSSVGTSLLRLVTQMAADVSKSCASLLERTLSSVYPDMVASARLAELLDKCSSLAENVMDTITQSWRFLGRLGDWVCILSIALLLSRWHARVIDLNYIRWKRARTTIAVLRAVLISRRVGQIKPEELQPYLSVLPPPVNPYIAKSLQSNFGPEDMASESNSNAGNEAEKKPRGILSKLELVRHLLLARADAVKELHSTFQGVLDQGVDDENRGAASLAADLRFLRERGATF